MQIVRSLTQYETSFLTARAKHWTHRPNIVFIHTRLPPYYSSAMPRPTRARVASSRRGDVASDPAAVAAAAQQDKPPIHSDETDIYGVSDRELERQRKQKDAPNTSNNKSNSISGRSTMAARSTRSRAGLAPNAIDAIALKASQRRRDAAMDKLDTLTSTTNDATESSELVELGRKDTGVESSLLGPRGGHGNLSGMEIHDDEIFGNLDSSFDVTRAGDKDSSSTTHAGLHSGTRSADTSTFNVSVFRRQPARRRQSSIVSKDDAPIRPSSRGPMTPGLSSTFSLGNFRRRQRQPSILMSSAQKARLGLPRSRATSAEDNAVEETDLEESFLPEAEGTPIRLSRGRRGTLEEAGGAANEFQTQDASQIRSTKRKSTENHESEMAKRQAVESESDDAIHQSIEIDDRSSPPSFVERRRRGTPELDEDILAPPASSSSREGSPTMWPSLKNLGKKRHAHAPPRARKLPVLDDDMSDVSDPPSLTHSPNFKATNPAVTKKRKDSPKLSTADLEALLPRRRRKARRDDCDLEDAESSTSEQEERPSRAAKKKPTRPLNCSSKTNQTNADKATSAPTKRTTRRTYGSRSFNKENTTEGESIEVRGKASTPLDDTAFEADVNDETTTTLSLGDELKAASRKFREVDQWELDFEEVVEPSSDLPEGR